MIIIIGATSFLGVHTVNEFLKQGKKVLVTGRNNKFRSYYDELGIQYINLDITMKDDFNNLPKEDVECVILLAGLLPANVKTSIEIEENAEDYFKINVLGTINVLEYCRRNNIKRVISTCSYSDVFNSWNSKKAITENEQRGFKYTGDHAVYVISKNASNDVLEYYSQQHGMKNAVFRLPPVYGVGPHGSLYVNGKYLKSGLQIFIDKARMGEDIIIYGNKHLCRDVVYVKDVAQAFLMASQSDQTYGLYNITSGRCVTLEKQALVIAEIFCENKSRISKILYRPDIMNNTPSFLFSIEKAKRDFGYKPKFSEFEKMMLDFKKDMDKNLYRTLFNY